MQLGICWWLKSAFSNPHSSQKRLPRSCGIAFASDLLLQISLWDRRHFFCLSGGKNNSLGALTRTPDSPRRQTVTTKTFPLCLCEEYCLQLRKKSTAVDGGSRHGAGWDSAALSWRQHLILAQGCWMVEVQHTGQDPGVLLATTGHHPSIPQRLRHPVPPLASQAEVEHVLDARLPLSGCMPKRCSEAQPRRGQPFVWGRSCSEVQSWGCAMW